jgi:hypothetical protein
MVRQAHHAMAQRILLWTVRAHFITRNNKRRSQMFKDSYIIKLANKHNKESRIFCGENTYKNADCPNCKKKLLKLLSINTNDEVFAIQNPKINEVSIFFCWTCKLSQGEFIYELIGNNDIKIHSYEKGDKNDEFPYNDFPYEDYPLFFPKSYFDLVPLNSDEKELIVKLNKFDDDYFDLTESELYFKMNFPFCQLGGTPHYIQGPQHDTCPICEEEMEFLATISDVNDKYAFSGNDCVQMIFKYCNKCSIVKSYHEVD